MASFYISHLSKAPAPTLSHAEGLGVGTSTYGMGRGTVEPTTTSGRHSDKLMQHVLAESDGTSADTPKTCIYLRYQVTWGAWGLGSSPGSSCQSPTSHTASSGVSFSVLGLLSFAHERLPSLQESCPCRITTKVSR